MTNSIRVSFVNPSGTKHADVTLNAELTADEVIYLLAQKDFISFSYDYRLRVKRIQKVILPNQTLASVGVLDGDPIFVETPYHLSENTPHPYNEMLNMRDEQLRIDSIKKYGGLTFDGASYRNWWHSILRNYGKYSCYGIFLLLPSDTRLLNYLTEYGNELNILATHCLIIAPSPHGVKNPDFQLDVWQNSVQAYVRDGYGRFFSSLFSIPFSSYPCFAVFNDFQSADYALVSLKDMDVQEISKKLRAVFSVIDNAALTSEKPVKFIENSAMAQKLSNVGIHMITDIKSLTKTTLETVIETLIKSSLT